jgi:putative redox protein
MLEEAHPDCTRGGYHRAMCDAPTEPEVLLMAVHSDSGPEPFATRIAAGHHTVVADEPASRGGGDKGASPTALLLGALASCTSITLTMYAARKGWQLGDIRVDVALYHAGEAQRIERKIHFGGALTPDQQTRLLEIADKTPVTRTLREGLAIKTQLA